MPFWQLEQLKRRNSDEESKKLQYTTSVGAMPTQVLSHQLNRAPPPGQRTRSTYPHVYRNQEGEGVEVKQNFHTWELRRGAELHEYPVKGANGPRFDFDRRTNTARQVEAVVHPNDRARVVRNPLNDAGSMRGVVDQYGNIVGAMAHPTGNARGFQRAQLESLNSQGRQELRTYQDRYASSKSFTFPPR